MTVRTDLRTYALAQSAISSLIGERFYWMHLPEGVTYPAVRSLVVSRPRSTVHAATPAAAKAGIETMRVQLDLYAKNGDDVENLSEAFKTELDGLRDGNLAGVLLINELDAYEDENNVFRIVHDYMIHYRQ